MKVPQKILVVVTRRIGDVLLTTPLIRSLRRAWPDAGIDVLVFAGTEGILAGNPDIDQIITIAQRPKLSEHLCLFAQLWRRYDIALSTMSSDRPTLYARVAGKYCAGVVDAGSKHRWKRMLLTRFVQGDNLDTHTVLSNLKLADILDVPRSHEVVAAWQARDEKAVRQALSFDPDAQIYAVLHIHPMYVYKAWRRDAWAELADWLQEQGIRIVLTGGNSAAEIADVGELMKSLPHDTVNVTGKLNLSGVAFLLSKARVYVGPDTVVTHLAAASGVPTVALFGPSNPVKWGPWPAGYDEDRNPYRMKGTQHVNNVVLLQGTGDCVPCFEEGCERHIASLSDCLQKLPAARAIESLRALMNLTQQ